MEAVREMLSESNSTQHRLIMNEIFNQPHKPIAAVVYDYEIYKVRHDVCIQQIIHDIRGNLFWLAYPQRYYAKYLPIEALSMLSDAAADGAILETF